WLMADCVTLLIWAALVKLSVSAKSQNIFKLSICISFSSVRQAQARSQIASNRADVAATAGGVSSPRNLDILPFSQLGRGLSGSGPLRRSGTVARPIKERAVRQCLGGNDVEMCPRAVSGQQFRPRS